MSTLSIRRAKPTDQPEVESLVCQIMDREFREAKTAYPMDDIRDIGNFYGGKGEAFFVALNGHHVIGTVGVKKEDENTALLRRLFVAAEYRHQKVGKSLVERVLQFCRESGYGEIVFKATSKMEAAVETLKRSGFELQSRFYLGQIELLKLSRQLAIEGV